MFNNKEKLLTKALELYAGNHITKLLDENKEKQFELFMDKKNLTVSFYNINFSHFKEAPSKVIIEILNVYYDLVFSAIENNNGIIINMNGDQIISVFSDKLINNEMNAIKSYFEVTNNFKKYTEKMGLNNFNIIWNGINSGDVLIGNIGSKNRLFYSIMGDHVNLASRLVNTNRLYNTNIIISNFTYQKIQNEIIARELDSIRVWGLEEPQKIFEVISIK